MCDCLGIADCLGNLTYVVQRLASCVAATAVITCIMTTLLIMLAIGVGTGYNYCFVENKLNETMKASKGMKKPTKMFCEEDEVGKPRRVGGGEFVTSNPAPISKRKRRSKELDEPQMFQNGSKVLSDELNESKEFESRSDNVSTESSIEVKPTMVVPLQHFALMVLIKNLQMKNKNYTLELVAAKLVIACFTCTMLVTCIIMTLVTTLMLGIGIGYNYCFVDIKTKHRYVPSGIRRPTGKRIPFYPGHYSYFPRAAPPDTTHQISTTESMLPLLDSESNTTMQVTTNSTNSDNTTDNSTKAATEASIQSSVNSTVLMFKSSTDITKAGNSTETTKNSNGTSIGNEISIDKDLKSDLLASMKGNSPSMIIPISGLDLIALLSKLRSENRNYSLQIVTS